MAPRHLKAKAIHAEIKEQNRAEAATQKVRPGMKDWHLLIGDLVHECAGTLAEHRCESPAALAGLAAEWVNTHARDTANLGNLAKARAQVGSLTCAYLMRYAPGPDAQYLGAELRLGTKRVDLAWFIPDFGVVIDELKTTNTVKLSLDSLMLAQPRDYAVLGATEWGHLFAGVRFLPLRNPHQAVWITADGNTTPLWESPAAAITTTGWAA